MDSVCPSPLPYGTLILSMGVYGTWGAAVQQRTLPQEGGLSRFVVVGSTIVADILSKNITNAINGPYYNQNHLSTGGYSSNYESRTNYCKGNSSIPPIISRYLSLFPFISRYFPPSTLKGQPPSRTGPCLRQGGKGGIGGRVSSVRHRTVILSHPTSSLQLGWENTQPYLD